MTSRAVARAGQFLFGSKEYATGRDGPPRRMSSKLMRLNRYLYTKSSFVGLRSTIEANIFCDRKWLKSRLSPFWRQVQEGRAVRATPLVMRAVRSLEPNDLNHRAVVFGGGRRTDRPSPPRWRNKAVAALPGRKKRALHYCMIRTCFPLSIL